MTETKTIAALAEILRADGVRVRSGTDGSSISFFCDDESQARKIADIAIDRGYSLAALKAVWPYHEGRQYPGFWWMLFHTASLENAK